MCVRDIKDIGHKGLNVPLCSPENITEMKKAIYIILAAAALASCSKNEVIDTVGREVISFGDVFVDHSTRAVTDPTHTTASLGEFFVYGNVTGNVEDENGNKGKVNIYKGDRVYKDDNGIWNCNAIQYWVPECGYDFVAVSDVEATDPTDGVSRDIVVKTSYGLPASIEYNAACQKDLLYATRQVETDESADPQTGLDENGHINPVAFTFDHLLSKVQFTFTNDFRQDSGVQLTVTDIRINNAPKTGTYTIGGTPEWAVNSSFTADDYLSFGSTEAIPAGGNKGTSSTQCVLIPCKQAFNITFTVEHNKGGSDTEKTITTEEITLEKGHFYNFTAVLNSGNVEGVVPITINVVTSDTWGVQEEQVGPVYPESN